jgi:hypothetical protein
MPDAQKKPCSICHRWFRPDVRVGKRQRACGRADCQAAHRRKVQAVWRARNPDYFIAHRLQKRSSEKQRPEPLRLPAPLSRLPWDVSQDAFGVQGADFLGVMGKVLLRAAQFEFRGHVVEFKEVAGTLPPPVAQSEFRGHVTDSKKVASTLPPPLAQSEISLRAG